MEWTSMGLWKVNWLRMGFAAALFLYAIAGSCQMRAFDFLHGVDLLIHEAGHPIFGIFGSEPLMMLGGTLLQLVMPVAFMLYFCITRQYYAAAIVAFWLGQSLYDVAYYVADARAMVLPLVGGGIHDWNYLLGRWHLQRQDAAIAAGLRVVAWAFFITSFVGGVYFSMSPVQEESEDRPAGEDAAWGA